jgi:phosphatidylserine/phosphatidylglycerophosphate/cardiolipin synthase-like enzyme
MKKLLFIGLLLPYFAQAQTNILDARSNYDIDESVTVSGIVTSGAEFGTVRYIQDETAGIAIFPGSNWNAWTEPQPGDIVTITGVLSEFNGLLEVGPTLTSVTIESSGNTLPEPALITPDEASELLEGFLVQVSSCFFDNGGATISGNSTYNYNSGGEQGTIYIRSSNPLVGSTLPISPVDVIGIMSQFSFDGVGGYQLLPRGPQDLVLGSTINLTTAVTQSNITQDGFTLSWNTDQAGTSLVEYGPTPALGLSVENPGNTTIHTIDLSGLEAGTIYYAKVSSDNGVDVAESTVIPYATVSESSGTITVYFNKPVDTSVATIEEAISIGNNVNDTIAAYLDRAQHTLDIMMYNINDQTVVNAINDAYDRGVQIRYIAQGTNLNAGVDQFNANIPVWMRMDDNGSGMHNKIAIIDADYADLATVIGGSCNWTTENFIDDYNNVIIFQDQSLARGYRIEFEELWGGSGMSPVPGESKFGGDKSVNTPRKFIIGGSPVELYFSPTDNTTQAILSTIMSANTNLEFATLAFTRDDLAEAVIDRHNDFFCEVHGIIEQTSGQGNEYEILVPAGVQVYSHEGISGQIHHKYAIVDHSNTNSDPIVLTGSHNWSASAETVNDENTVVVHDARVANLFYQEFYARLEEVGGINVDETAEFDVILYPNPSEGLIYVDLGNAAGLSGWSLQVFDMTGRLVLSERSQSAGLTQLDLSAVDAGIYCVSVIDSHGQSRFSSRIVIK